MRAVGIETAKRSLRWPQYMESFHDSSEEVLGEMITMIKDYALQDEDTKRPSVLTDVHGIPIKRYEVLGDRIDAVEKAVKWSVIPKDSATTREIKDVLRLHFLFSDLGDEDLTAMVESMEQQFAEDGEEIVCEGESGDTFFVLLSGQVNFHVGGTKVGSMNLKGSFGDLTLMYSAPRAATVISCGESEYGC